MVDLSVVSMDDFRVILGMDFFEKVKAFHFPFANTISIMDDSTSCMVVAKRGNNGNTKSLTVMQLEERGVDEKTYGIISMGTYINLINPTPTVATRAEDNGVENYGVHRNKSPRHQRKYHNKSRPN